VYFVLVFLILFCSKPTEKNILTVAIPSDISAVDPLFATDLNSRKLNKILFRKLFLKEEGKIKNDLVKFSNWSKNELELILNEQSSLNSTDVVYSLNRAKNENHPQKFLFDRITNITSTDKFTIKIQFTCSKEELLDLLSNSVSSIYSKDEHQKGKFLSDTKYRLEKWDKGNEIILVENNKTNYKKIYLKIFQNSLSGIYLFSKGKVDVFKIPYFLINHPIAKQAKIKTIQGNSIQYIAFNHNNPCFDREFKLALNYAIDREKILEKLFYSLGDLTYLPFPKKYVYPNLQSIDYQYFYNPNLAKNLLEKSKCFNWKTKSLELRMRADDENKAKSAAIVEYLKALGLKVKIVGMEKAPLYKENSQGLGDLTLLTWYADYDSAINFIDPLFASDKFGNGGNRAFYKNSRVDELIFLARKTLELTEKSQKEILEILKLDNPWIFLWSLHENYLIRTSVYEDPDLELFLF